MGLRGKALPLTGRWPLRIRPAKDRAGQIINFINALCTPAAKQFTLAAWQEEFIRTVYAEDSTIRTALVSVPRKNGKTGFATALILAHFCAPALRERGDEFYCVANSIEQASLVYRMLEQIIRACPALYNQLVIGRSERRIESKKTGSFFRVLSAQDEGRLLGLNPTLAVIDELGAAPNAKGFNALNTAFGARDKSLLLIISTQAADDDHIMSKLYDRPADESFHKVCYSTPNEYNLDDEEGWRVSNPSLGSVRRIEELRAKAREVKALPQNESAFRLYYLNQRVRVMDATWITPREWASCKVTKTPSLKKQTCYLGIDCAAVVDLAALIAYFPDSGWIISHVFCPKRTAERPSNIPYRAWHRRGLIEISDGETIDVRRVFDRIEQWCEEYDVQGVGYDRWGMSAAEHEFQSRGISTALLERVGQGYHTMSRAMNSLEELILTRQLKHNGNPIVAWQLQNIRIDTDPAGNRKPNKTRSADKIDSIVALLCAVYCCDVRRTPPGTIDDIEARFLFL